MADNTLEPDAPYCSNCKYPLSGLTESSKCPECGRPLVEVLTRRNLFSESGKRYRSKATLLGWPVIDIALGPKHGEMKGKARGVIAIGDMATGWLAIGGLARGIVAIGGLAVGLFSIGGCAFGLLVATGGVALGGLAAGGGAVGGMATGGGAAGYIAQGGGAVGHYARGGQAYGNHVVTMAGTSSPDAVAMFDQWSWFFGAWPPNSTSSMQPMATTTGMTLVAGALIGIVALAAHRRGSNGNWPG